MVSARCHRRGSGSYTSGRGDTALSIYAGVMGLAFLTVIYALVDTFRKVMSTRPEVGN